MMCPRNGECMMNVKEYTGVNFCVSPSCIYSIRNFEKERMKIADKIARLLKKDKLDYEELLEIESLKLLYAEILQKGE